MPALMCAQDFRVVLPLNEPSFSTISANSRKLKLIRVFSFLQGNPLVLDVSATAIMNFIAAVLSDILIVCVAFALELITIATQWLLKPLVV